MKISSRDPTITEEDMDKAEEEEDSSIKEAIGKEENRENLDSQGQNAKSPT